jgi:hypothetical protein
MASSKREQKASEHANCGWHPSGRHMGRGSGIRTARPRSSGCIGAVFRPSEALMALERPGCAQSREAPDAEVDYVGPAGLVCVEHRAHVDVERYTAASCGQSLSFSQPPCLALSRWRPSTRPRRSPRSSSRVTSGSRQSARLHGGTHDDQSARAIRRTRSGRVVGRKPTQSETRGGGATVEDPGPASTLRRPSRWRCGSIICPTRLRRRAGARLVRSPHQRPPAPRVGPSARAGSSSLVR